jgi:aminoglycoside phosphotransferase (APT) family kinase protein
MHCAPADTPHYDFSGYNVLTEGNRITGVVDWNGATNGDAAFDLVTLAFYTYGDAVRSELLAAAATQSGPDAVALYVAHMVLRSVDWTIRNHEDFQVQWFLGISTDLLAAVGAE